MLNIVHILLTHNSAYTRIEELKAVNLKCNLFAFLSMSAEYLLRFDFSIFQGSVATWVISYQFSSKFHMLFSSAKILKNR